MAKKQLSETIVDATVDKSVEIVEKPIVHEGLLEKPNLIGRKATAIELGKGTHLAGQTLTLSAERGSTLEVTPFGVLATNASKRELFFPWANLAVVELSKGGPKRRSR